MTGGSRATACLSVCQDGTKLLPLIVYLGKPTGRIAQREIPLLNGRYQNRGIFTVQDNAWCDRTVMLHWVETILRPWALSKDRLCLLMLDSFSVHLMGVIGDAIANSNVKVCSHSTV